MWRVANSEGDPGELADPLAWINSRADFFDAGRPLFLARAPGRLDLMGGIADYSGSLVLELPLAASTWVAAQATDTLTVIVESSEGSAAIPLGELVREPPLDYAEAHALLTRDPNRAWAGYVAGAVVVLQRERGLALSHGLKLLVRSQVAIGKGISSSAALEVAAMEALAALAGIALTDREVAILAQKVENAVVGAPCGVMDQMTAACGRRDHLLELLCQPAEIIGQVPLPDGLEVFGVDSGIRHAVSGAGYGTVRAAAFMGYRIVAELAGLTVRPSGPGQVTVRVDDPMFGGYLANISPSVWRERFRDAVPERLSGRAFLERYQGSTDDATEIEPERIYPVRVSTEHPIEEHARVRRFRELLAAGAGSAESRVALGGLMYASHASYSACGLGADATDRLVALCRAAGPDEGLYGAKITGGGSGGTVAVLAAKGSRRAVEQMAERYRAATGRAAAIFSGSSDGAHRFGIRKLVGTA